MIQLKNNAQSMLAYPISAADTTLTVIPEDIGRFPALTVPGDHFYCALADSQGNLEFVRVTGANSQAATLTVVRGAEGTTARGWSTGDRVQLRMSMATWADMAGDWWQRVKTAAGDALAPTLVSVSSFSLSGDWTGEMQEGRRLRITSSNGTLFKGHVTSATLADGTTTITVGGDPAPQLAGTLVAVDMGFSTEMESHLTKMRADSALASKTEAAGSASTASMKASEASASAGNALASETAAAASASTATTKAGEASASATAAKTSETNALASKNAAATSASTASTKATDSADSASAALASQNAAKISETAAAGSASTASTKAGEAATSATAAKASETAAATSASTATTKAVEAASSASSALTSKNAAATSAATATTKATEAATSATSANAAKVAAETARDEAQNIAGGNYVLATRKVTAGTGLSGGGDLTADRTLAVEFGTAAGTVCQGNDARLSDARTPTAHAGTHKHGGTDPLGVFFFGLITPYYGELDATGKHPLVNGVANTSWHICDGTDGTPDMRDRIPLGTSTTREMGSMGGEETTSPTLSSTAVSVSGTTGATTLTIAQMPKHSHSIGFDDYYHNNSSTIDGGSTNRTTTQTGETGGSSSHSHTFSSLSTPHTHFIQDGVSTMQPYIVLHYLMYTGA